MKEYFLVSIEFALQLHLRTRCDPERLSWPSAESFSDDMELSNSYYPLTTQSCRSSKITVRVGAKPIHSFVVFWVGW